MAPQIFLTGATGYIGGDVLAAVSQAFPDCGISCLVRDSEKGTQVASQYAKIRLVYGTLNDEKILEEEAKSADIVLNCANSDNEKAANALIQGLRTRNQEGPAFLIHTSGTGLLCFKDKERKTFGEESSKVYDDWEGIGEVTSLPDTAPHRLVDKLILGADSASLRTAIVCPPTIYGLGRGPGNRRGHQLNELARCTLERREGFMVGAGKTRWPNVHLYDLSKCYVSLVQAALKGGGGASWGKDGYYFTENGEHVWGDISKMVAKAAHQKGLIPSTDISSVSPEESDKLSSHGSILWGANSRCKAIRARKVLGWLPSEKSLEEEVPEAVEYEARKAGLIKSHAAQVEG